MKTIEDLKKINFIKVGYWYLNNKQKLDFNIIDPKHLQENHLLYAFEADLIVRYIGITEKTLKNRLTNYKNGNSESSGSTNKKLNNNISEEIKKGFTVNIWMLKDSAPCNFFDYEISLATGIEKSLIRAFDLKENLWNKRGTNPEKSFIKNTIDMEKNNLNLNQNEAVYKLGKETLKGWILFKNDLNDLLPQTSSHIDIHYKNTTIPGCRFTRSLGNKKINGGYDLFKIFENDFKNETEYKVTIIDKKAVKIDKINVK